MTALIQGYRRLRRGTGRRRRRRKHPKGANVPRSRLWTFLFTFRSRRRLAARSAFPLAVPLLCPLIRLLSFPPPSIPHCIPFCKRFPVFPHGERKPCLTFHRVGEVPKGTPRKRGKNYWRGLTYLAPEKRRAIGSMDFRPISALRIFSQGKRGEKPLEMVCHF